MEIRLNHFGDGRYRTGFHGRASDLSVVLDLPVVQVSFKRKVTLVPRRTFLLTGAAGVAAYALPSISCTAAALILPTASGDRRFSVLYKGAKIGSHTVVYSSATGEMKINTEIDLLVKVAFFTVYAFSHHSSETWHDGQLKSLTSETMEHGERLRAEGIATPLGFRVVSKGGPFIAPAETLTSNSLWTSAVLDQTTVVDAQHGGVFGVSSRQVGVEQIEVVGRMIRATRYTFITPYLAGSIWYDENNLWVRGEFERDGSRIQYQLEE